MPNYNVTSPLRRGEDYPVGSTVEMSEKDAQELIGMGVLAEIKTEAPSAPAPTAPADDQERIAAIRGAIAQLDKADASLFLKDGTTPDTKALTTILGWPVSAADRDLAIAAE
jgi:hypothetical protein